MYFNGKKTKLTDIVEKFNLLGHKLNYRSIIVQKSKAKKKKKDEFKYKFLVFKKVLGEWYCNVV